MNMASSRGAWRSWRVGALLLLGALAIAPSLARGEEGDEHLLMGNPSQARDDGEDKNNFLMKKKYFALSYNNDKGAPNWVSWHLTGDTLGDLSHGVPFKPDATLPEGFKVVRPHDYTNSGFDRGHMCPHGDRNRTPEQNKATFVMTNVIPQAHELNANCWDGFEEYCRSLTREGKELYILCGPHGQGGSGKIGFANTIAGGKVVVPDKCWKVALVLDDDGGSGDDLQRVDAHTRLIAVVMPNNPHAPDAWAGFRTTVRNIEELTGFTFFSEVPAEIIDPLKEIVDDAPIEFVQPAHSTHRRRGNAREE